MTDILEHLANYEAHIDRAIERRSVSQSTSNRPLIVSTEKGDMIVMDTPNAGINDASGDESGRSPWMLKVLAAAALVLVVVGVLYVITGDDESTRDGTASPAETDAAAATPAALAPEEGASRAVIEAYIEAYNSGDLDAAMELFSDDSSVVGHPFAEQADGLEAIRSLHMADMRAAALTGAYTVSNIAVDGNTVTWDQRWTNRSDEDWCAAGQAAEVENGVITSWTWPAAGGALCSDRSTVIEEFVRAFNSGDIDDVMAVFGEDSVVDGHFVARHAEGLDSIRSIFSEDLDQSATLDAMVISNVEIVGNTVTWDDRVTASDGVDFCRAGHSAVVEDGTIATWDWSTGVRCSQRSDVIEAFAVAYNHGNLDGVMQLFNEESVVIGYPGSPQATGLLTLERLFAMDIAAAAEVDPVTISNVQVIGNTVTWDQRWTNNEGDDWCSDGHSAVMRPGAIVSWTWPEPRFCD